MHQLILPSDDCRRLHHHIDTRNKQPGPGTYEYCVVCTLGYQMAYDQLGDEEQADLFVQDLRRETVPMTTTHVGRH